MDDFFEDRGVLDLQNKGDTGIFIELHKERTEIAYCILRLLAVRADKEAAQKLFPKPPSMNLRGFAPTKNRESGSFSDEDLATWFFKISEKIISMHKENVLPAKEISNAKNVLRKARYFESLYTPKIKQIYVQGTAPHRPQVPLVGPAYKAANTAPLQTHPKAAPPLKIDDKADPLEILRGALIGLAEGYLERVQQNPQGCTDIAAQSAAGSVTEVVDQCLTDLMQGIVKRNINDRKPLSVTPFPQAFKRSLFAMNKVDPMIGSAVAHAFSCLEKHFEVRSGKIIVQAGYNTHKLIETYNPQSPCETVPAPV